MPAVSPVLVAVTSDDVLDLSGLAPTCCDLLEQDQAALKVRQFIASGQATRLAKISAILANRIATSDQAASWVYGTRQLMHDLAQQGLLA